MTHTLRTVAVVRSLLLLLLLLVGGAAPSVGAAPFTLGATEVRDLPTSINGRQYKLYIGYPSAYASEPTRRFPAIYFPDAYWDFALFSTVAGNLRVDGAIPDVLLVGIGYSGDNPNVEQLRGWDLTPGVDRGFDPSGTLYGHADDFIGVLEREIIPLAEREYRADPSFRVLAGNSFGGLFTTYVAVTNPTLFNGYIASAPSLWWRSAAVQSLEASRATTTGSWPVRLFFGFASEDSPSIVQSTQAFYRQAAAHAYADVALAIREMEGDRHSSLKAEASTLR